MRFPHNDVDYKKCKEGTHNKIPEMNKRRTPTVKMKDKHKEQTMNNQDVEWDVKVKLKHPNVRNGMGGWIKGTTQ